ncbi:MAG: ImmA/IrrE family metallo-endopeptidase [Clostridia bacterium]|nr:ImmA/IrrE family metallo-endopeptidase [Clostridia bacterium]
MSDLLYNYYKNVRNFVWKILIKYKIVDFPIKIKDLANKLGVLVNKVEYLPNDFYAVSYNQNGINNIDYISSGNINTDRFTIAHELGHLLLQHKADKGYSEYQEEQANIFASRLLAPMIIVREHDPNTPDDLARIFGLSLESATIRYNRYLEIKERNKFLTSELEREYYNIYKLRHSEE